MPLLASLPVLFLVATGLIAAFGLSQPLSLPVGAFYWDLFLYFDAAQRLETGQVPSVDFSAPVGPLSYYLPAAAMKVFPQAQPLLVVQWSYLVLTFPLMVPVLICAARRALWMAWALAIPFVLFSLTPANMLTEFPYIGSEAWGIYNRHSVHLIFVLVATVVFVTQPALRFLLILTLMLALFFTKITAFLAGGLILACAFFGGRIAWWIVGATGVAFLTVLGLLELQLSLTSGYLKDIASLVGGNTGDVAHRFVLVGVNHFTVFVAGALLACLLFFRSMERSQSPITGNKLIAFFANDGVFAGFIVLAGFLFETQNTGTQPLFFLWPIMVKALGALFEHPPVFKAALVGTIAFASVPQAATVLHKAAALTSVSPLYEPMSQANLKTLGQTSSNMFFKRRADVMRQTYIEHRDAYRDIADADAFPAVLLRSEFDFQLLHLQTLDGAIDAILKMEERENRRFQKVWVLDFTSPLAHLMNRDAPKYVPIGVVPRRTFKAVDQRTRRELEDTDLVLVPTCPPTPTRRQIYEHYAEALEGHERVTLTPCFDALLKR